MAHFLPLIDHNSLLVYYRFECKGNFYQYGLYYTWVQMLLQIRPLLRLGSKCYYGSDFYYAWVQMLLQMAPLLHLRPVSTLVPSTTSLQQTPWGQKILDGWIFCPSGQKKRGRWSGEEKWRRPDCIFVKPLKIQIVTCFLENIYTQKKTMNRRGTVLPACRIF